MKTTAICLSLCAFLAACGSSGAPSTPAQSADDHPAIVNADVHPFGPAPSLPEGKVIQVKMFKMTVPVGTVTHNDPFWKLIQEDVVDVAAHELLYENGIRVGRGRVDQWASFRDLLDRDSTVVVTSSLSCLSGQDFPINMTPVTAEETLWFFDQHGPSGRSYADCVNLFSFRFEWAVHKTDTVRMRICPVVVTTRTRLDYTTNDDPIPTTSSGPEHLYDLRLFVDIPPGEFLVIAPSPDASDPNRIGHRFLTVDGPSDRYEELLVLVPHVVGMEDPTATTKPAH
jgi:hypothetical protein